MEDAPPSSRRARRLQSSAETDAETLIPGLDPAPPLPVPPASARPAKSGRRAVAHRPALEWIVDEDVPAVSGPQPAGPDLLARRPHRSPLRAGVLVPIAVVVGLVGAYAGTTLLWPLHAVPPTVAAAVVADVTAPVASPVWPEDGSAAVAVDGIGTIASGKKASSIASITKLVTALVVLDEQPLAIGEDGPSYSFGYGDRVDYWNYLASGESALNVPVGGSLTEYQILQGMLIGSAGNYAQFLASRFWPSDAVFAQAAATWMDQHGLDGITITQPSGIDSANVADPASLVVLAEKALANPVIAEIVRTKKVTLPGAGTVTNTNDLLKDASVVGVKTGSLWDVFNLLAAKDVTVGDTTVRVYAAVLGQPTDKLRDGETKRLLDQVADEVAVPRVLPAGTVAGVVSTPWGARVDVVTDEDASAVLWNGATAEATTTFSFGDERDRGDDIGTLTLTGPLTETAVSVSLASDIEPPDAWWRLTHPLELFGLAG